MTTDKIQIEERKSDEVIQSQFVDLYKTLHKNIWHRLIQLNTSITIMERIASYPINHLQPFMVERFGYKKGDFPITESVCERTIALPFCNNLTRDEVAIVCRTLKEVLDKNQP